MTAMKRMAYGMRQFRQSEAGIAFAANASGPAAEQPVQRQLDLTSEAETAWKRPDNRGHRGFLRANCAQRAAENAAFTAHIS